MKRLLYVTFLLTVAEGCRTSGVDTSHGMAASSVAVSSSTLAWPAPGTTNNDLDIKDVLAAWQNVKNSFYTTASGYTGGTPLPPLGDEPAECLKACPSYYSDLVCHFYCWHPSYSAVIPNVRGCFSTLADHFPIPDRAGSHMAQYPELYDYCLYQPYDAVLKTVPAYDAKTIATNKAAGNKVGVLKWVSNNEEAAFQYVMYTEFNPFAFKIEDQQDAINAFYSVNLTNKSYDATDVADVAICIGKRPLATNDPRDGTHCSYSKSTASLAKHQDFVNHVSFLNSLIAGTSSSWTPVAIFSPSPTPAPSLAPTPPPPPPPAITGSCSGFPLNGFCWYSTIAASPGDCTAACAAHGGIHPATAYNFTNNETSCGIVANALANGTLAFTSWMSGSCGSASYCGCIYAVTSQIAYLCPSGQSSCAEDSSYLRACACNQ